MWTTPFEYRVGETSNGKADVWAAGRFISVRFTSMDNLNWKIRSYSLDVEMGGLY